MTDDFYCDEVLSGRTPVRVVHETTNTLAYHHTRPHWPVHIVVIPKEHVPSLTDLGQRGEDLLPELIEAVRHVAALVEAEHGAVAAERGICAIRILNLSNDLKSQLCLLWWHVLSV